jgi:Ca-activated chloride channel family protein
MVFLIDVSGSMSDTDKLPLVKRVLTKTIAVLQPTDTISIVTYADQAYVRLEPTPVSESDTIVDVIDGLYASGSTAGAQGIQMAYEQAEAGFIQDGINHVMLCTDGDFNVGVSSTDELTALIEEKRETGITLTALGFGTGNLNEEMMEEITNAGNGIFGVISSADQADRYVEDRMLANIYYVAKDMKIQVEFNAEKVLAYRLLGYENRAIADSDFRNDRVDAGEVGTGHRVTALYELILSGGEIPEVPRSPEVEDGEPVEGEREISPEDLVLVKVRYKKVDASIEDAADEVSTTLTEEEIAGSLSEMDDDFKWAAAVSSFAEILKKSPYVDTFALDDIEDIVAAKEWLDSDRAEFVDLFDLALRYL